MLEDDIKAVIKPQYVDHIPKAVRGNVEEVLDTKDQRGIKQYLLDHLDLTQVRGADRGGVIGTVRPSLTAVLHGAVQQAFRIYSHSTHGSCGLSPS